jgi:manganese/zinc/iron transport system ATP- binding protein
MTAPTPTPLSPSPHGHAALLLRGVTIGYDQSPVLAGIDLRLPQGSFTALLGANGTGKTTLLRTLLGIIPPLSGSIEFPAYLTRPAIFGYVPQRETLDPIYLLSSLEVVLMGAFGRVGPGRFPGRHERLLARECLAATGADSLAAKPFAELSGGQKQRVLIARALLAQPDILFLDEPTAGIDPASAREILALLSQLSRERGLTLLMVSHDLPAVRRTVERVIWLHQGRVLEGPVQELLGRENLENLLACELE